MIDDYDGLLTQALPANDWLPISSKQLTSSREDFEREPNLGLLLGSADEC